mmetsp:Transcript_93568/g.165537  ORF Transcript_93568/g.165537 Transcript_93568/m.165537 type:complete len:645 (-) Transcript_93568:127-2061(-)
MTQLLVPMDVAANNGSSEVDRDIDHLSLAQRLSRAPDPLGDVITWLDSVDLGDELGDDLSRVWQETGTGLCGEGLFGVHELLADTPSEGTAATIGNPKSRCNEAQHLAHTPGNRGARPTSPNRSGGSPLHRQPSRGTVRACCFDMGRRVEAEARNFTMNDQNEDEEWDARQKQTGAAGRLVVYSEGDRPRDDVLIRGGAGRRVIVTAVTEDGKAHKAGVKAGDVLVSIDGKKDFVDKTADLIHTELRAPVMLVFMGFVGKLQAEVRLNYAEKVAGMASQQQVVFGRPDAPVQVIDEVVFQPSAAPLFLTTTAPTSSSSAEPASTSNTIQAQPPTQPLGLPAGPSTTLSDGLGTLAMKPVSTTPLISLDSLDLGGPLSDEAAEAGNPGTQIVREDTVGAQSSEAPPLESSAASVYLGAPPQTPVSSSPRARASSGKLAPMPTRENTVAPSDAGSTTASTRGDQAPNAVYELQVGEARHLVAQALAKVRAQEKSPEPLIREMNRSVEDIMAFAQVRRGGSSGHRCDIWDRPQAPQAPRTPSVSSGGAFNGRFKEEEGPAKPSDAVGVEATAPPPTTQPRFNNALGGPGAVGLVVSPETAGAPAEVAPFSTASATFVSHGGNRGDTSPAPLDHSRSSDIIDPSSEML